MPTKEELETMLKASQEKNAALEKQLSAVATKPSMYIKDRKISKFSGEQDVTTWTEDVAEYIDSHFTHEHDKTSYIRQHLEGPAKVEVKFRDPTNAATSQQLLQMLKDAFSQEESTSSILQKLYSRTQGHKETIEQFCTSLMELLCQLRCLGWKTPDQDKVLKERLAEGVSNTNLRRELKRLNTERPSLQFHELRKKAVSWLAEDPKIGSSQEQEVSVAQEGVSTTALLKLIQEQNKALEEMRNSLENMKSTNSTHHRNQPPSYRDDHLDHHHGQHKQTQHQSGPMYCRYCKRNNHVLEDCRVLKRVQQSRPKTGHNLPQKPDGQQNHAQQHLNYNHPRPGAMGWEK